MKKSAASKPDIMPMTILTFQRNNNGTKRKNKPRKRLVLTWLCFNLVDQVGLEPTTSRL